MSIFFKPRSEGLTTMVQSILAERERIAKLVEEWDDFEYKQVCCNWSAVDERPSMKKLADLIRDTKP
jgi:hypothetical protein